MEKNGAYVTCLSPCFWALTIIFYNTVIKDKQDVNTFLALILYLSPLFEWFFLKRIFRLCDKVKNNIQRSLPKCLSHGLSFGLLIILLVKYYILFKITVDLWHERHVSTNIIIILSVIVVVLHSIPALRFAIEVGLSGKVYYNTENRD